jgi:hypothetical protein
MLREAYNISFYVTNQREKILSNTTRYCFAIIFLSVTLIILLTILKEIFKSSTASYLLSSEECFTIPTDLSSYQVIASQRWLDSLTMQELLIVEPPCPFSNKNIQFEIFYRSQLVAKSEYVGESTVRGFSTDQKPILDCHGEEIAYFEFTYPEDVSPATYEEETGSSFSWSSFEIYSADRKNVLAQASVDASGTHYFSNPLNESETYGNISLYFSNSTFLVSVDNQDSVLSDIRIVLSYLGTYYYLTTEEVGICDEILTLITRLSYYCLIGFAVPAVYLFVACWVLK